MIGEIVVKAILVAIAILFGGILFFVWLNRSDKNLEEKSYDQGFEPGGLVSSYRVEPEPNPTETQEDKLPEDETSLSQSKESPDKDSQEEEDSSRKEVGEESVTVSPKGEKQEPALPSLERGEEPQGSEQEEEKEKSSS